MKHNCSLDAEGFGYCDCISIYNRRGAKLDHDSLQLKKKRNDAYNAGRKSRDNKLVESSQDSARWQGDSALLPIGSSNVLYSSKGKS